jgi:F-type H+-transporting ATPase subunit a
MDFLSIKSEIPGVAPEKLFEIWGWPVSNSFLESVLILVIFVALGLYIKFTFKQKASKPQAFIEVFYEWLVGLISQITGDKERAKTVLPLVSSIFLFIALSNIIGIIPGLSSFTYDGASMFRTPTTDFNTTFGLALGMIVIINIMSLYDYGFFGFVGKYIQLGEVWKGFRGGLKSGLFSLVSFGIGLLDIISEFAKIVSLSLRLFGNVYTGEVLIVVIFGALAYVAPGLWSVVSVFFGLVQAVVFSALVTAYYSQARKPKEMETLTS